MIYELLEVIDAKYTVSGNIDMTVRVKINDEEMTMPFGYSPDDPYGLSPAIKAWWMKNEKFPVQPFYEPPIEPPLSDQNA